MPDRVHPRGRGSRPASRARPVVPAAGGRLSKALRDRGESRYVLRLYVTGSTWRSVQAIERVRALCEERLQGRYSLDVIDIYQLPALAKDEQIVATPTLVKVLPAPLRRFIGDLASAEKVLFGMDLREER